jgi:hypothetical protein
MSQSRIFVVPPLRYLYAFVIRCLKELQCDPNTCTRRFEGNDYAGEVLKSYVTRSSFTYIRPCAGAASYKSAPPPDYFGKSKIGEEVLGRTNRLLSFNRTRTTYKTKKLGEHTQTHRKYGDLISLLTKIGRDTDRQTARCSHKP